MMFQLRISSEILTKMEKKNLGVVIIASPQAELRLKFLIDFLWKWETKDFTLSFCVFIQQFFDREHFLGFLKRHIPLTVFHLATLHSITCLEPDELHIYISGQRDALEIV